MTGASILQIVSRQAYCIRQRNGSSGFLPELEVIAEAKNNLCLCRRPASNVSGLPVRVALYRSRRNSSAYRAAIAAQEKYCRWANVLFSASFAR